MDSDFLTTMEPDTNSTYISGAEPSAGDIIRQVAGLCLGLLGILFNSSVIAAIKMYNEEWRAQNFLILNLAASDACVSALFITYSVLGDNTSAAVSAVCARTICEKGLYSAICGSLFGIVCLGIDLLLAVTRPLHHYQLMSPVRCKLLVAVSWLTAICTGFSDTLVYILVFCLTKSAGDTFNPCDTAPTFTIAPFYYLLFFYVLMTAFFMINVYCKVANISTVHKKGVITLVMLYMTFLLCWLPQGTRGFLWSFHMHFAPGSFAYLEDFDVDFGRYFVPLFQLNFVLDPLIHAFRAPAVRRGYAAMYKKCRRSENNEMNISVGTTTSRVTTQV